MEFALPAVESLRTHLGFGTRRLDSWGVRSLSPGRVIGQQRMIERNDNGLILRETSGRVSGLNGKRPATRAVADIVDLSTIRQKVPLESFEAQDVEAYSSSAARPTPISEIRDNKRCHRRRVPPRAIRAAIVPQSKPSPAAPPVLDRVGTFDPIVVRDRGLAAIVLTSDDAIVSKRLDGTVTSWNPAAEKLFGWSAKEMIGNSIQRIVPPERRSDLATILARLGRGERIDHHETVRVTRDGRRIDVSVSISPVRNDAGEIVGAAKICRDVTARKRAEAGQTFLAAIGEVLSTSLEVEATLEAVTRFAVGPIADIAAAHIVEADGSLSEIAIADGRESWTGRPHSLMDDADDLARIQTVLETNRAALFPIPAADVAATEEGAGYAPGEPKSMMVVPLTARGQMLGALSFYSVAPRRPYDDDDLQLACDLGRRAALAVDNARLYAESRSAETRYRALFCGGAVGVVVVDSDGRYLEANDAALRLLGRSPGELQEMRIDDGCAHAGDEAHFWSVLRAHGTWHGEFELHRADDTTVPVEVHSEAIDLPDGRVYLIQWLDISARKTAEHFEDVFLADLAHDLNNPLASIRIQAQLLQRRLKRGIVDEQVFKEALAAVESSTGRMSRRITELSDIARLRLGGSLELRLEAFDLIALIQELSTTYQQTTERHVVTLTTPVSQLPVKWDRWRLERVVDNLLTNAIKYSPLGGEIGVDVSLAGSPDGDLVCLTVSDEGVGIPKSDLPFVFDRFRRGSNVATRFSGMGIGLAEAKQIIELHGGTIDISNQEPRGTIVSVRLPLAPCAVADPMVLETID